MDGSEHTAPLWDGQPQVQTPYRESPSASPQTPAAASPDGSRQTDAEPAQRARPRRLVELVAVAVLAAILSSAGTYTLTRGDLSASPAVQGRTSTHLSQAPVVQANPAAPNWTVTAAAVTPSVVAISVVGGQTSGQGSGVIFDTKGHILTNNHVVTAGGAGSKISVTLNDQRTYDATIVGTDTTSDLAVIKLTAAPNDLKAIALGDDEALKVGEPVMAVGNPLGLAGTVTTGIVSALNRPVTTGRQQSADPSQPAGAPVVTNAVQTSAAINPGNSGGALVNGGGQLVGINSAIAQLGSTAGSTSPGGNIGIGFAIPVDEASTVADQLISSGKAAHGFLGVTPRDAIVADGAAKRTAAVIASVANGSPADDAGLKDGDAIIAINGKPVDGAPSLVAKVHERTPGDKVTITVLRDGQTRQVSVTLAGTPGTN